MKPTIRETCCGICKYWEPTEEPISRQISDKGDDGGEPTDHEHRGKCTEYNSPLRSHVTAANWGWECPSYTPISHPAPRIDIKVV